MSTPSHTWSLVGLSLSLLCAGCMVAPGKPTSQPEIGRPEQVASFETLYQQNCAGCHGAEGERGAAISLANPVYLALADTADIERVTRIGVAGTTMPGFSKQSGGMLTDQQIHILAQGMKDTWGKPHALAGAAVPAYAAVSPGNAVQGQKTFTVFCARCHGTDGTGIVTDKKVLARGSLVDPSYLALVSDQGLRSTVVAGLPDQGMPDWRSDLSGPGAHSMTEQEITDTVAWLASHRVSLPGQPYPINQRRGLKTSGE